MPTAQEMVTGFAQRIGIDRPAFTEGIATIRFDDMAVNFHADDDNGEIALFTALGAVPPDGAARQAAYSLLLRLNNFGHDTGGGILGVDPAEQSVFFSRAVAVDRMEAAQFENVVEAFLNLAEGFALRLAAVGKDAAADPSDAVPPAGMRV